MPIINQGKASFSSFDASGECTISISPLLLLRICSLHAFSYRTSFHHCAADFSLLNLPKGKSLGRSKPATNS